MDEQILTQEATASEELFTEDNQNTPDTESTDELALLREQVRRLTEELNEKNAQSERIASELGEFYELFPEADIKALPEEVWDGVKAGTSLAASYALYNHRVNAREARAREINERNSSLSTGRVSVGGASEYFTPDEVKAMSRAEVKANYSKIIESMKKWN